MKQFACSLGRLILAASLIPACSGSVDSPKGAESTGSSDAAITSAVPKKAWFKVEVAPLAKAVPQNSPAQADKAPGPQPPNQCQGGPPAMFAAMSGDIMSHANGVIEGILTSVEGITQNPPLMAEPGHAVWGPLTTPADPIVRKLDLEQVGPNSYHFVLSGKPKAGDESTWRGLFQGVVDLDNPKTPHGDAEVDFGAIHSLDPSSDPVTGAVSIEFAADPAHRVIDETFVNVAGKQAPKPNDAHYHFEQDPTGAAFDFVTRTDFDHDGQQDELLHVQARWVAPGAGKASAVVTGGDLGDKQVGAIECWDPQQRVVFYGDDINANPPAGDPNCCVP